MILKLIFDRTTCLIKQARTGNILRLLPYLEHQVHYQTLSNQFQTLPQIYSIHFFPFSFSVPQFREYFPLSPPSSLLEFPSPSSFPYAMSSCPILLLTIRSLAVTHSSPPLSNHKLIHFRVFSYILIFLNSGHNYICLGTFRRKYRYVCAYTAVFVLHVKPLAVT